MINTARIKLLGMGILLFFLFTASAGAGVNLKNGNFYISYSDIKGSDVDGLQLEIVRTYNSKSTTVGLFGYGWGYDYETRLNINTDGSLVVHENGSGAARTYWRTTGTAALEQSLRQIESALDSLDWHRSSAQLASYLTHYSEDAEFREEQERFFQNRAFITAEPPRPGDVFWNYTYGATMIIALESGFLRLNDLDGTTAYELFDTDGQLVRVGYRNGKELNIHYDREGRPVLMDLGGTSGLQFRYSGKHLASITDLASGSCSEYTFDGDDLVSCTGAGGLRYEYSYDSRHNMTRITYMDGSQKTLEYEKKTSFISRNEERNGDITLYRYGDNIPQRDYWTEVTYHAGTEDEKTERQRWIIGVTDSGYSWVRTLEITRNDMALGIERTEDTILSALILGKDARRVEMFYGRSGRLDHISGPGVQVDYTFGTSNLEKISCRLPGYSSDISYNDGEFGLEHISDSHGNTLRFSYGDTGLLSRADIHFETGENFTILYDEYEEISRIEDDTGREIDDMTSFWDRYNNRIYRSFFEFYQFHKSYAKIFWKGEFLCGDCSLGFQDSPGRLMDLAKIK